LAPFGVRGRESEAAPELGEQLTRAAERLRELQEKIDR